MCICKSNIQHSCMSGYLFMAWTKSLAIIMTDKKFIYNAYHIQFCTSLSTHKEIIFNFQNSKIRSWISPLSLHKDEDNESQGCLILRTKHLDSLT